jgi:hypothetical protein
VSFTPRHYWDFHTSPEKAQESLQKALGTRTLVGYSRQAGALVVAASRVTKASVPDGSQLRYLLRGL